MKITIDKEYDRVFTILTSQFLKKIRLSKKMTMKDVVGKIDGLTESALQSYEIGRRTVPLSVLKALFKLYDLDYVETFSGLDKLAEKNMKKYNVDFSEITPIEFK